MILFVLLFAAFALLFQLGYQAFQDDEALYAQVSSESISSHDFLSFTYRGEEYFNKPPILFWLMDISREVIPNTEAAARLPSAIAGVFLVFATMLLVFEATQSTYAAALGGAILTTTASFLLLTRAARFDSLVTLWIVLAVYAFLRALEDKKWFLWFGAFVGLAILTKGPIAAFAILAALATACVYRRFDWIKEKCFWGGVGIAFLIVVPWHLYETIKFGSAFWSVYFQGQLVDRIQENLLGETLTNGQYLSYIFQYAAPWASVFLISVASLPFLWKRMTRKLRAAIVSSLVALCAVLVVCFFTQSKAYRYLYSVYPFMASTIALSVFQLSKLRIPHIKTFLVTLFLCIGIYAAGWSVYNGFSLNLNYPYFNNAPAFLSEEKAIGEILLSAHVSTFYVYQTVRIRPIIFYSHIVNPYNMPTDNFHQSIYIVMPTASLTEFELISHPHVQLDIIYHGAFMLLAIGKNAQ